MKTSTTIIFALLIVNIAIGQSIALRFYDVKTGLAVQPKKFSLLDVNDKVLDIQTNYFSTNKKSNEIKYSLPPNNYKLFIEEEGYKSTIRRLSSINNQTYHIYLSPRSENEKFKSAHLKLIENKTFIAGYVTNTEGVGLEGVNIQFENKINTKSGIDGYFEFHADVSSTKNQNTTLVFTKENYQLIERNISELWSKGSWQLNVQLPYVTTTKKTTEPNAIKIKGLSTTYNSTFKLLKSSCILPLDIIVGTNCVNQICTGPNISLELDDYVKNVLPNEWIPSWQNDQRGLGGIHAFQAGTVAIRSYASWWVLIDPISPNYDICNSTTCQVFEPFSTTPATDAVVDLMEGYYLLDEFGGIMQTEFARETNNGACGNGRVGHTRFGPPSNGGGCCGAGSGDVCFGVPLDPISHTRGMCQFGTIRWATGYSYPLGGGSGSAHGKGLKTWQQMCQYYYCNGFTIHQCDPECDPTLVLSNTISSGLYEASDYVQALGIINTNSNVTMTGGNYVEWNTGFDGRAGSVVIGEVSPCIN